MIFPRLLLVSPLVLLFHLQLFTQNTSHTIDNSEFSTLLDRIDKIAAVEMADQHIPGMTIAIVQAGKTILKKGYGYADMYTGKAVDPDQSIFRIGSVSKAVTLLALTKLIDEGRIDYDDDVSQYFPSIQNPNDYQEPLRIRHLLSHTTGLDQVGLDRHTWRLDLALPERNAERPSLEDFLSQYLIRRAPAGERYVYDTYGTSLAGAIIEKVVGKPFRKAMDEVLFAPLGMTQSGVDRILDPHANMASGHGFNDGAYQVMPYELYSTTPASSIDATAGDMALLLEALTGDGTNKHGRLFTAETLQRVLGPEYRPHPDFVGTTHGLHEGFYYGVGEEAYEVRSIAHGGDMIGHRTQFRILPEYQLGIFISVNRNREAGGGNITIDRTIVNAILEHLKVPKRQNPHPVPGKTQVDLSEYRGNYFYAVFCHTCAATDVERGAWEPGWNRSVKVVNGALVLDEQRYLLKGDDVFVREDGYDMLFFTRNEKGQVISMQAEDDNNTFERIDE
ncbi:MAG: serine hydrolase [Bacteroidota bacterium]